MVKIGVEQASLAAGSVARKKITEQECPSNELFMAAMWKTVLKVCWQRHVEWLGRQRCAGRWSGNDLLDGGAGNDTLSGVIGTTPASLVAGMVNT
jgi:hypothetical protein